jgi:hypothetical protein
MPNYKEAFMAMRTLGILHIFYLQYTNIVHLPFSAIFLLTVGSLGLAWSINRDNDYNNLYHKIYNYSVFIAGMFVIIKKYA